MAQRVIILVLVEQLILTGLAQNISYRLPQEVKPLKYYLTMRPDFENNNFSGDVLIQIEALQNSSTITLHQNGLRMPQKEAIEVIDVESSFLIEVISVGSGELEDQHFFIIYLARPLRIGKRYLVRIPNFNGIFKSHTNYGFYYATYLDENGNNKTFATTQFQPTYAREAFPCFDEPALKAKFILVIKRPNGNYTSVANTPRDEKLSYGLTDIFQETKLMSTYLIAFIVSEMRFSNTFGRHRVLAPCRDIFQGRHKYALNLSFSALNEMEDFIIMPYTFEKLDHVSIPHEYFLQGAMENWGLITYRDDYLLESVDSAVGYKKKILMTISHEIAHQWFGNLVSPKWWDHIWLNEGFATYISHYLANKIRLDLDLENKFVIDDCENMLVIEGYHKRRAMNKPVEKPEDIINAFDEVAYLKSACVIHMLAHVLSPFVFRKGLITYIHNTQFQATAPNHLYFGLQEAISKASIEVLPKLLTVEDFMSSWDSVSGFPLVTVTRSYGNVKLNVNINQKLFQFNDNASEYGKWKIPINYAIASNPSFETTLPMFWLQSAEDTITISYLKDNDWLILNNQQTGYYRVNYDHRNWGLISDALLENHTQIHPLNRAKLISDCNRLAFTYIPDEICKKFDQYIRNEDDPVVWIAIFKVFQILDVQMYHTEVYDFFKARVIYLLENIYNRLTFEEKTSETLSEKDLRSSLFYWLCKMGHEECRTKLLKKYMAWKNGKENISSNLIATVFCGAMRHGDLIEFDYLFNLFTKTENYEYQLMLVSGLSCMNNTNSLIRILQFARNKGLNTLLKDITDIMSKNGQTAMNAVIEFFGNNTINIHNMWDEHGEKIIFKLSRSLYSANQLKTFTRLGFQRNIQGVSFQEAAKIVSENVNWLTRNKHKLEESMKQFHLETK